MNTPLLTGTITDSLSGATSSISLSDDGTISSVFVILLLVIALTLVLDFVRRLFSPLTK